MMKSVFKKAALKLLALALAFSTGLASLCPEAVYAAEEESKPASESAASSEETASEETAADGENTESSGMNVYKDGKEYGVKAVSASSWSENAIEGSDEPTKEAVSKADFIPGQDYSDAPDNLYALTVATGINAGSTVEYFAIRYLDKNNLPQTQYIFPKEFAAADTTNFINKFEKEKKSARSQNILDQRHVFLSELGYTVNKKGMTDSLAAWGVDDFLFKADNGVQKVTGIEVFMSNGKWTVQGMTVSKVTGIGGYGEYGFYSGKYFLGLKKQRICELLSRKTSTLTFSANGDTLLNIGGADSAYFGLKQISSTETSSDPFTDLYTFRMDILDQLDAGIETFIRDNSKSGDPADGTIAEDIVLELEYKDRNGWVRTVTMPVLLSVLGQYKQMNKQYGDTVRTMGLAQRGDILAFTGCLPEFASLVSTKVYVGSTARERISQTGGIVPIGNVVENSGILGQLDSDAVSFSGISIYEGTCRMSNTPDGEYTVKTENGGKKTETFPSYSYAFAFSTKTPKLYYTTINPNGIRINPGTSDSFKLTQYDSKNPLIAETSSYNVMIQLKTDSMENAATAGNIKIRLSYQDTSGTELTTDYYNVRDEVLNYIGYWPTAYTKKANFGYSYGMTSEGFIEFPVQINNIGAITNVEMSLAADADEWQISGMCISVINAMGRRMIYGRDLSSASDQSSYQIVRSVDKTEIPPFPVELSLLFTPGDSYSFSTGTGTIVKPREIDFNTVRYSMSYDQTKDDYGFARAKKTYDVNVKVADDSDAGNINGDSGSRNHFYFQLRFKNGNSAYVLANQQLSSDAFRAGYDETFAVSINRDYGDLSGVRIIPEDISDDSDVFDKLNIELITVTERTNSGTAEQYVIDNVGWIGIDYHDKSQDVAIKTREGRTARVISTTYSVSYKQMVINLLCEINTLPWDTDYLQVEGSISCDLEYIDKDDQPRTVSFDVVSRMAAYMNKTARSLEGKADGSNSALYDHMGTISDPQWMLRPNHYDRFILPSIANPKIIKSMTFIATSRNNKPAKWVIGDVALSRIMNDSGIVKLTSNGEYLRSMDTVPHCSMIKDDNLDYKELFLPAGEAQKLTVYFNEQTIAWAEDKSWTASVSKLPESTNDTMNVYVYPSASSRNIEDVKLSIKAQYSLSNSRAAQVNQSLMNVSGSGTDQAVFYITDLKVPDMKNLNSLKLNCRSTKTLFDHAIVQQERDGVIVRSYTVNFGNSSATLGLNAAPTAATKIYDPKKQVLMLSFGTKTEEKPLFALTEDNLMPSDIAVCLKYKSSLPTDEEYYSPYVYLTEAGYSKIYPGMMAEIPFDTPYVSEITGYRIVMFGGLTANVEGSLALNYSYSDNNTDPITGITETSGDKLEQVYSFNMSYSVDNAIREYERTAVGMSGEDSVVPLQLSFATAGASEGTESGINVPVAATFNYIGNSKKTVSYKVSDLRQYIQSDDKTFATGQKAAVSLFLPECVKLQSIVIKPSSGEWNLESIDGSLGLGEEPINRTVNKVFDTDGGEISLNDPSLLTIITADSSFKGVVTKHSMNVVAKGGSEVSGSVRTGDEEDFEVAAVWVVNGVATDVTLDTLVKEEEGFSFITPLNESSVPQTYTISVWSTANEGIKDVINVTVPVAGSGSQQNYQSGNGQSGGTPSYDGPPQNDNSGSQDESLPDSDSESGSDTESRPEDTDETDESSEPQKDSEPEGKPGGKDETDGDTESQDDEEQPDGITTPAPAVEDNGSEDG